jgi:cytoskeleton protein RodZ
MVNLELETRRKRKAVSLEEISKATKIGMRSLQAIEAGEFQKLPGGVYSTSYIRQYARAIDFDETQILELYYSVMGITPEPQQDVEQARLSDEGLVSRFLRHTSAVLGS